MTLLQLNRDGLGFELLGQFENHEGFDGKMLGEKDAAYHLEFTRKSGETADRCPSEDNLLVFYIADGGPNMSIEFLFLGTGT